MTISPEGGDKIIEQTFKGPLHEQLRAALRYIKNMIITEKVVKHPDRAEADRFYNYPYAAIEEALANAVYHKAYDEREPIEVRVNRDMIEIISHPGPDRSVTIQGLKEYKVYSRRYRNRRIGEFLKDLHLTEGRNTGFKKILGALRANGSPLPEFETDEAHDYFVTRFFIHEEFYDDGVEDGVKNGVENELTNPKLTPQDIQNRIVNMVRVGKTYLIRQTFESLFTFEHSGLANADRNNQIHAFTASLKRAGLKVGKEPINWLDAFELLKDLVERSKKKKKILFIDELSWMDTQKSGLLIALENFWNGWASARKDVVLVVCASATSWMLDKIIHNKGGLYNRLTDQIYLKPFKLSECEEYLKSKNIVMGRYDILEMYMAIGGVPFYWTYIKKGLSVAQNIDAMFFAEDAPMKDEFKYLYASLFRNPQNYIAVVSALGKKKIGLTRNEISEATKLPNSGFLTKILDELISCGFIRKYTVFGKKTKDAVFQLTDQYSLFYFHFLQKKATDEHYWTIQLDTSTRNAWCSNAFERVCMDHVSEIKAKLGISGVLTEAHSWISKSDDVKKTKGAQIDLVLARKDRIINLCEMKYSFGKYTFTRKDADSLLNKIAVIKSVSETKCSIHPVLVTPYGLAEGINTGLIQAVIKADDLFVKTI